MRRYWQPFAGVCEVEAGKVLPVRLLGEDLVLYRDRRGNLGLLDAACSHRGLSMSYGMVEDQGIRCPYHGWLYANDGSVLETPTEPASSRFKEKMCQRAYPVQELGD